MKAILKVKCFSIILLFRLLVESRFRCCVSYISLNVSKYMPTPAKQRTFQNYSHTIGYTKQQQNHKSSKCSNGFPSDERIFIEMERHFTFLTCFDGIKFAVQMDGEFKMFSVLPEDFCWSRRYLIYVWYISIIYSWVKSELEKLFKSNYIHLHCSLQKLKF